MIESVKLKELKVIRDYRGFLMEILRSDDKLFKGFGQAYITNCRFGIVKAWHYHRKQYDNFTCVSGNALVVLYDDRKNSPTRGELCEFKLSAPDKNKNPLLLQIPKGVYHGFTATDCKETTILNIPTQKYNYKNTDEFRLPWNTEKIPYKWPKYVKEGG